MRCRLCFDKSVQPEHEQESFKVESCFVACGHMCGYPSCSQQHKHTTKMRVIRITTYNFCCWCWVMHTNMKTQVTIQLTRVLTDVQQFQLVSNRLTELLAAGRDSSEVQQVVSDMRQPLEWVLKQVTVCVRWVLEEVLIVDALCCWQCVDCQQHNASCQPWMERREVAALCIHTHSISTCQALTT